MTDDDIFINYFIFMSKMSFGNAVIVRASAGFISSSLTLCTH